jgi:hypothetical protein
MKQHHERHSGDRLRFDRSEQAIDSCDGVLGHHVEVRRRSHDRVALADHDARQRCQPFERARTYRGPVRRRDHDHDVARASELVFCERRAQQLVQLTVGQMQDVNAVTVAVPDAQPVSIDIVDERVAVWAASGAMALTGRSDRPPLGPPAPLVDRLVPVGRVLGIDALPLLGERAALLGLTRHGATSCGLATRLLRARDGWFAVTLSRDDDVDAVPAWLELDHPAPDVWTDVAAVVPHKTLEHLVTRGMLLGLPVAALPTLEPSPRTDLPVAATPYAATASKDRTPLVVDLSSLWAGPLCSHLLQRNGARVVKVESAHRPDAARAGSADFFDLLNGGKESVVVDVRTRTGRRALQRLVAIADVVIEASRPRALEQLGIVADDVMRDEHGPTIWVSITGHGRDGEGAARVAFGDDAAVEGGLVVYDDHGPCFCADAIADPLTGMVAAAACLEHLRADNGRWLLDVAMANVAAHFAGPTLDAGESSSPAAPPIGRVATSRAAAFGRDTRAVLEELTVS